MSYNHTIQINPIVRLQANEVRYSIFARLLKDRWMIVELLLNDVRLNDCRRTVEWLLNYFWMTLEGLLKDRWMIVELLVNGFWTTSEGPANDCSRIVEWLPKDVWRTVEWLIVELPLNDFWTTCEGPLNDCWTTRSRQQIPRPILGGRDRAPRHRKKARSRQLHPPWKEGSFIAVRCE